MATMYGGGGENRGSNFMERHRTANQYAAQQSDIHEVVGWRPIARAVTGAISPKHEKRSDGPRRVAYKCDGLKVQWWRRLSAPVSCKL